MPRSQKSIEFIRPPNALRAKLGPTASVDLNAVKRAEAALSKIKAEFSEWVAAETERLVICKDEFAKSGSAASRDNLFCASLDLKSQALTFESPIVARIAASLCRLLEGADNRAELGLVCAHVDAIRIAVRDQVKSADTGITATLVSELESQVTDALRPL